MRSDSTRQNKADIFNPPEPCPIIFCQRNPVLGDFDRLAAPEGILFDVVAGYLDTGYPGVSKIHRSILKHNPEVDDSPLWVNGSPVHWTLWKDFRVQPGDIITVRATVHGGGGKNPLATVLTVAVMAASIITQQYWTTPILAGGTLTWGTVAAAGIMIGGGLLIGALFPASQSRANFKTEQDPQRYTVNNTQNQKRVGESLPLVMGDIRHAGDYAADWYSVFEGEEQYLYNLFCFSAGTVELSEFRIGDTAIGNYAGAEVRVYQGWQGEAIPWFDRKRTEIAENLELSTARGWVNRTTPPGTTAATLFVIFPQGIIGIDKKGRRYGHTIQFGVRYRKSGDANWISAGTWEKYGKSQTLLRLAVTLNFSEAAAWDVGIYRISPDYTQANDNESYFWSSTLAAFQTTQADKAIVYKGRPMTLAALRLKASDELSGVVSTFNARVRSYGYVPDDAGGFDLALTENCAALALYALTSGEINDRPIPKGRIDAAAFTELHARCEEYGFTYNAVHTDGPMRGELAAEILAVCLGGLTRNRGLYSVAWDDPAAPYVDACTPRTAWGYEIKREYPVKRIDGLRMEFQNRDKEYQTDEITAYADGVDETTAGNVKLYAMPGVVTADLAWKVLRLRLASIQLRPETHTWYTDWRSIDYAKGQKISSVYDVSMVGSGWGHPVSYLEDPDNPGNVKGIVCDFTYEMDEGKSYVLRDAGKMSVKTWKILTAEGSQNTALFEQSIPQSQAPELMRVLSVGELGRDNLELTIQEIEPMENFTARVTALPSAPRILEAIDGPMPPWESKITTGSYYDALRPNAPYILHKRSDESCLVMSPSGLLMPRIGIAFDLIGKPGVSVVSVAVQIRAVDSGEDWQSVGSVDGTEREIFVPDVIQGETYRIRLAAISAAGVYSPWVELEETVVGMTTPPPDILTVYLEGFLLKIVYERPIDFAGYEVRMAFSSAATVEASLAFESALFTQDVIDVSNNASGSRAFFIYAVDLAGIRSLNPAVVRFNYEGAQTGNVILEVDHKALGFPGRITGGHVDDDGNLVADDTNIFWRGDGLPHYQGGDAALYWGESQYRQMEYITGFQIPPGVVGVAKHVLLSQIRGQVLTIEYNVSDWEKFWIGDDNALFWRGGDDDFFYTANWVTLPDYLPIDQGYLSLRIVIAGGEEQAVISEFTSVFDVPDIDEALENVALDAAWNVIATGKDYLAIKWADWIILNTAGNRAVEILKRFSEGRIEMMPINENREPVPATVNIVIRGY